MSSGIETTGTAHRVSRLTRVEAMFPSEEDRLRNTENTAPQVAQPALILEESAKADGVRRAMLNVNDAISMVQIAERARQYITEDLHLLRDLSLVAKRDDLSDPIRSLITEDLPHLLGRIDYVAANAKYRGLPLVNGTLGEIAIQSTTGPGELSSLYFDELTVHSLGLEHASLATIRDANVTQQVVNRALGIADMARKSNGTLRDDLFASISLAAEANPVVEQQRTIAESNLSNSAAAVLDRVHRYLEGQGALAARVQSWGINRVSAGIVVD